MNKDNLKEIVKSLKLEPTQDVLDGLEQDFEKMKKSFIALKEINIDGIEPMVRVDDTPISFLREDIPQKGFSKKEVLQNAPSKTEDYIIMKKVVK